MQQVRAFENTSEKAFVWGNSAGGRTRDLLIHDHRKKKYARYSPLNFLVARSRQRDSLILLEETLRGIIFSSLRLCGEVGEPQGEKTQQLLFTTQIIISCLSLGRLLYQFGEP